MKYLKGSRKKLLCLQLSAAIKETWSAGVVLVIALGTCGRSPLFDLIATNTCDVDFYPESVIRITFKNPNKNRASGPSRIITFWNKVCLAKPGRIKIQYSNRALT